MTRLNSTENFTDMSWDEYVLAVEDTYLIEAETDIAEQQLPDISTAFDAGMTPLGCVLALMEGRCPSRYSSDWRTAA
ncbi:hypothetical protein [Thalassospira marina]|uniref:hypothetical protein n=1 Tax=Thalassospira marina TaxID=2048283 RepID=UPI001C2BE2D4|nr:hypothetical protein [Thalassospira marina]